MTLSVKIVWLKDNQEIKPSDKATATLAQLQIWDGSDFIKKYGVHLKPNVITHEAVELMATMLNRGIEHGDRHRLDKIKLAIKI